MFFAGNSADLMAEIFPDPDILSRKKLIEPASDSWRK
jgi:hypothetical protein